jgi:prepilin-type N-terminal cleavage/methylation domain-containing protein/prepilin-type processing-associated H-X9-DG protein
MIMNHRAERSPQHGARRALTLIELMVVLTVIGIVAALTLPAIQSARESARRSECANRLRQIGLALNSYQSSVGSFPHGSNGGKAHSIFTMLLPYLEQKPLYDAYNFEASHDPGTPDAPLPNRTVTLTTLSSLLCPSEGTTDYGGEGCVSYAGNRGWGYTRFDHLDNGAFTIPPAPPVTPGGFTDGLSQTASLSEWVVVVGSRRIPANGAVFHLPQRLSDPDEIDEFVEQCRSLDPTTADTIVGKGYGWTNGNFQHTLYNHLIGVNDRSCSNAGLTLHSAWTSGSWHPGGAHVLFADGHVRFVSDGIDLMIWRAMGTRNGGELVNNQNH